MVQTQSLRHAEQTWHPRDIPVYRKSKGGVLLIGTLHDEVPAQAGKAREFKRKLGRLEHLAIEGDRALHASLLAESEGWDKTYEGIAVTCFKGKMHFLDERIGTDYATLLLQHGVSPKTYGVIAGLSCVGDVIGQYIDRTGIDFSEIERSGMVRYYIEMPLIRLQERGIHGMRRVKKREMMERTMNALRVIVDGFGQRTAAILRDTYPAFEAFLGAVRDVRVYGPRLIEMAELKGSKGAVVGTGHLENLELILGGGTIELGWNDYINGLDNEMRKGMRIIENAANR